MKRITTLGILAFSVAFSPATAAEDSWYLSLNAGTNISMDANVDVASIPGVEFETSQDSGSVLTGAVGYSFPSGIRLEAEMSSRKNDYQDITVTAATTLIGAALSAKTALSGKVSTTGFMANAALDFKNDSRVQPFVMGGLGMAKVTIDNATAASTVLVNDEDYVFAFQFGGGVDVIATENVSLGLQYRFFGSTDPEFIGTDTTTELTTENLHHSFMAGFTYRF